MIAATAREHLPRLLAPEGERAEEVGGTLTIDTTPEGATVTADLPLVIPAAETPRS
ncbi:hypothetical protein [Streptomyces sp. NPDC096324]|uniref:hypothetical protein n=1 Tax=Streptomyces sp. NPDC096324 TaxID=3366085 RepID=UPI003830B167